MYGGIGVSTPSLNRESTGSLIMKACDGHNVYYTFFDYMYMYTRAATFSLTDLGCLSGSNYDWSGVTNYGSHELFRNTYG